MGWAQFARAHRSKSLGSAEADGMGSALGGRIASEESVCTTQSWASPLASLSEGTGTSGASSGTVGGFLSQAEHR